MEKYMLLCKDRHNIPEAADGAVFDYSVNPLAVSEMEAQAAAVLAGTEKLNLYVTGLTVALVAVINACRRLNIGLTLYHYNRDSGTYYPQKVVA